MPRRSHALAVAYLAAGLASGLCFAPPPRLRHPAMRSRATRVRARCPRGVRMAADDAPKPPAPATTAPASAAPLAAWTPAFKRRRLSIFCFTVMAYAAFYITRNSLVYTAPAMVADAALGIDITSIGVITSVFPLFYGCSKFVSGVVGDVLSPRAMLAFGLALTA